MNAASADTSLTHTYAVIMAGGSGTRFWPVSTRSQPKQLVTIIGEDTFIQATVARLQPAIPPQRILVITTAALLEHTRAQLPMLPAEHIIAEPVGRDTAPCVGLAAMLVQRMDPQATMILLPADHVIDPVDRFQAALAAGVQEAQDECLVTFGIQPSYAATGYGYIELDETISNDSGFDTHRVARFVEKPEQAVADDYYASGRYRWNSGIFVWRSAYVLDQLRRHCQWLTDALAPVEAAWGTADFSRVLDSVYPGLQKISIDYALMEQADSIRAITAPFRWDDLGSWDALYDHLPQDEAGVAARGEHLAIDCRDSLFFNSDARPLCGIGLEGLIVVNTPAGVLVCKRGESQAVKQLVDQLSKAGRDDMTA